MYLVTLDNSKKNWNAFTNIRIFEHLFAYPGSTKKYTMKDFLGKINGTFQEA